MFDASILDRPNVTPFSSAWPWRIILFLHLIFWASTVNPFDVPFRLDADSVSGLAQAREEGMIGRRVALVVLLGVVVAGLLRGDARRVRLNGALGWLTMAFIVWSFLSLSWADDQGLTAKRLLGFGVFWAGALWTALRLTYRDIIVLAFVSNLLTSVASVVAEVLFGMFRPWASGYRFAGLSHPNGTGECLALLVVAACALLHDCRPRLRWVYSAVACVGALLLLLTGSRTALLGMLVGLSVLVTLQQARSPRRLVTLALTTGWVVTGFLIAVVVIGDRVLDGATSAALLGRNEYSGTLGLRTPMWAEVIDRYILSRPLTGYGYGGFWTIQHVAAIAQVVPGMVFWHSHNGYLEIALGVGLLGAVAYVLTLLFGFARMVRLSISKEHACAFAAAALAMLLVIMSTETINLNPPVMPSFICMTIVAKCAFVRAGGVGPSLSHLRGQFRRRGIALTAAPSP